MKYLFSYWVWEPNLLVHYTIVRWVAVTSEAVTHMCWMRLEKRYVINIQVHAGCTRRCFVDSGRIKMEWGEPSENNWSRKTCVTGEGRASSRMQDTALRTWRLPKNSDLGFGYNEFSILCVCVFENTSDLCVQPLFACRSAHAWSRHVCKWGSRGGGGVHAFSCLFVFKRREPQQVAEVKPQLSDSLENGGGLGSGLCGGGVGKMKRVNDGGGGEAPARQFPWRWVIHRHRKCLTSHPEKCPQRPTCVKGVIGHN